ncbi:hypothetical protein PILCRDRAFT_830297 [Piloderma croceum F 1598]|uniref:Uncharacterized protein n=1 Tax=Piloderma croceum (strain F 1598) TaxID=765440 RepID=A0A0C3EFP1_PILCF|nr:hypothetical protein PILCRDRAFT_830297 [Piloderma croceum F 1598]
MNFTVSLRRKGDQTWGCIEEIVFAICGGKDTIQVFTEIFLDVAETDSGGADMHV